AAIASPTTRIMLSVAPPAENPIWHHIGRVGYPFTAAWASGMPAPPTAPPVPKRACIRVNISSPYYCEYAGRLPALLAHVYERVHCEYAGALFHDEQRIDLGFHHRTFKAVR